MSPTVDEMTELVAAVFDVENVTWRKPEEAPEGVRCVVRLPVPPILDGGKYCPWCDGTGGGATMDEQCVPCDGFGTILVCGRCHEEESECMCESHGLRLALAVLSGGVWTESDGEVCHPLAWAPTDA